MVVGEIASWCLCYYFFKIDVLDASGKFGESIVADYKVKALSLQAVHSLEIKSCIKGVVAQESFGKSKSGLNIYKAIARDIEGLADDPALSSVAYTYFADAHSIKLPPKFF